jgi:dTMP kinase
VNKNKVLKRFIVLEGLDGSGTTTQLHELEKRLKEAGIAVYPTCEPTEHEIGRFIRQVLLGDTSTDPRTLAYLFAADRNEHLYRRPGGICDRIEAGQIVVSDRYLFSSLAYQSEKCGFDFVFSLNQDFPLPEHLVFLDVSPETCQKRLKKRTKKELYDDIAEQQRILSWYKNGMSLFENTEMNIHSISGEEDREKIAEKIWSAVNPFPIK